MTKPPNYRQAECCYNCAHDGSYTDRSGDRITNCAKHNNEHNDETGICDDFLMEQE
jgi:hypothetical protein